MASDLPPLKTYYESTIAQIKSYARMARVLRRAMLAEEELLELKAAEAERTLTPLELELLLPQERTLFEIPPLPTYGDFKVTNIFRGKLSEIKHLDDGHKFDVDPFKKEGD